MKKLVILFSIIFVFMANNFCYGQSQTEWREGTMVWAELVAVSVNDLDTIFAFSYDSCYVSSDLAKSWRPYALPERGYIHTTFYWKGYVYLSITAAEGDDLRDLYLSEVGNLWRSSNGKEWTLVFDRHPLSMTGTDEALFFFSSKTQKNWKSVDGLNWTLLSSLNNMGGLDYVRESCSNGSKIVAFSSENRDISMLTFTSTNNGETWSMSTLFDRLFEGVTMSKDGKYSGVGIKLSDQHCLYSHSQVSENNFYFGNDQSLIEIKGTYYTMIGLHDCIYLGNDYWVGGTLIGADGNYRSILFRNGDIENVQMFYHYGARKLAGNDSLLVAISSRRFGQVILLGGHYRAPVDTTTDAIIDYSIFEKDPYPNPATDYINFQLKERGDIILRDMSGRILKREFSEIHGRLSLSGLSPGFYLLNNRKIIIK